MNSFLANGNLCCLLRTVANSLDPDQDRQNISTDLGPNHLTLLTVFFEDIFEKKVNFENNNNNKNSQQKTASVV